MNWFHSERFFPMSGKIVIQETFAGIMKVNLKNPRSLDEKYPNGFMWRFSMDIDGEWK